ncbi:DR2241 family protein [Natrialbaceae archaeon A-CW2]
MAEHEPSPLAQATRDAFLETVETTDSDAESPRIDFDGLLVEVDDGAYVLETPEGVHRGLALEDLERSLETVAPYVSNWYFWSHIVGGEGTARRAFLRWCEGTSSADDEAVPARYANLEDGIVRQWGQLQLTTRLDADGQGRGARQYEIRHVDDAAVDLEALETHRDPYDAREIVTEDADGRYRPLKTAPTLVGGWVFEGLSSADFVETVRTVYPATVENWHREQHDELDVDHWLEAAERQTGIYDVVDELPREALEWVTEACCVDSQCLKRREWHYTEDDHLEVDGGDGTFPCREPCSLVIAAARKWAILESEEEKTWHLELTTSELNQLAEIVDAVADDRTDQIREADVYDGANRYRARYLRAKRMDEGSLRAESHEE